MFKKGDVLDPNNYRGLSIMSTIPKLLAQVLLHRLDTISETKQLRAPTQAGFRKGARLEDNILLLQTTLQHAKHLHHPVYLLFVDLQKAYDTVDRAKLWDTLLH